MGKTITEEVEEARRETLESKLIVIGFDSEKKNQTFKDKLVSKYIEAEGYNKNFRRKK
jgi:hypothetical protein